MQHDRLRSLGMTMDSIIGHNVQRAQLLEDITRGNVAHAYLFAGPAHVGKMTVAKAFATQLVTRGHSPAEAEEAERRIHKLIHPDVMVLDTLWTEGGVHDWAEIARSSNVPQQHRAKAKMKTDVIGIEDVRALQDRLQETGEGTTRVCIIRSVQRMQLPAANAVLKLLEEPPAGRVFLLTASSVSAALPTMRSRTRVVRFGRVRDDEILDAIATQVPDDASFIVHLARGLPGTALRLAGSPDALREEKTVHAAARAYWDAATLHERLSAASPLHERGEQSDRFLLHLALTLRESPQPLYVRERALMRLVHALNTNAHRQTQVQRFAIECTAPVFTA